MINKVNLSYLGTSLGYSLSLFLIPMIILNISNSALWVSLSYALDVVPYILFTPIIGVIGDKYNKKRIILFGEICCLIVAITLLLIPYNQDYLVQIIILGFLISLFSSLHHPIFQAILPEIYTDDKLALVNANIASITSLTGIIAPAIIAAGFSFFKDRDVMLIIIFCYVVSAFCFSKVEYGYKRNNMKLAIYNDIKNSWNFIRSHKRLKNFSYLFFFANFGLKMVFVNLIWIFANRFGLDNSEIAINFIVIGLMSILGAKVAGRYLVSRYDSANIIIYSLFLISLFTISIIFSDSEWFLTLAWGCVSLLSMFIVVTYFTFRQKETPKEILSKVISITRLISYLAIPPASILSGYIIKTYGNEAIIYFIAGMIMLFSSLFFYFQLREKEK